MVVADDLDSLTLAKPNLRSRYGAVEAPHARFGMPAADKRQPARCRHQPDLLVDRRGAHDARQHRDQAAGTGRDEKRSTSNPNSVHSYHHRFAFRSGRRAVPVAKALAAPEAPRFRIEDSVRAKA